MTWGHRPCILCPWCGTQNPPIRGKDDPAHIECDPTYAGVPIDSPMLVTSATGGHPGREAISDTRYIYRCPQCLFSEIHMTYVGS